MISARRMSQLKLEFQKNWLVEGLPGLNYEDCQKLKESGIETTLQLCQRTRKRSSRQDLAAQMQIPIQQLTKWAVMADLSRVPSVGCHFCGLLLHIRIYSVSQLAQMSFHDLNKGVLRFQVSTTQQPNGCPDSDLMGQWIQEAGQLTSSFSAGLENH